jgi:hypothetical protein
MGRLELLLVLASAVILGSESRGTQDDILPSQIRDSLQSGGPGWVRCLRAVLAEVI